MTKKSPTDPTAQKSEAPRFKPGDRVTRKRYMDDGTWTRLGDSCLADSPLRHGKVVEVTDELEWCKRNGWPFRRGKPLPMVVVQWDDSDRGWVKAYFDHGIQAEER